jgi:hypothetical protein
MLGNPRLFSAAATFANGIFSALAGFADRESDEVGGGRGDGGGDDEGLDHRRIPIW